MIGRDEYNKDVVFGMMAVMWRLDIINVNTFNLNTLQLMYTIME